MATTALKRVLVVDDDPVVGKSFDRVLAPKGYAVIAAANGTEALARLEAENYDMVYADIKMPGMNGIEVARRIKASRPWLPVVIVTGYGTEANEKEARALGVADFLRKPLSPETIEGSAHFAVSAAVALPAPAPAARTGLSTWLMNVGMFFAAPFIGLAFILAVPFLGAGLVASAVYRKVRGS